MSKIFERTRPSASTDKRRTYRLRVTREASELTLVTDEQVTSGSDRAERVEDGDHDMLQLTSDEVVWLADALGELREVILAERRRDADKWPRNYFDCGDAERLQHEDVEDAVEEWVEMWLSPGCDVAAEIRAHAPVTVTEYQRAVVDDGFALGVAGALLERAAESFGEEFGDPDGDDDGIGEDEQAQLLPAMVAVVRRLYDSARVWNCEKIGERVLGAEEVEKMMRAHNPSWFEDG